MEKWTNWVSISRCEYEGIETNCLDELLLLLFIIIYYLLFIIIIIVTIIIAIVTSNRGRQIVASYLILDCGIDWRIGALHFESLLLDHDVCSNYGNWNAAAGLTGGRINKFNISKQARDYDPKGDFVKYWIEELRDVPAPFIFEPWKMSLTDQEKYNVTIGIDYPQPINCTNSSNSDGNNNSNNNYSSGNNNNGSSNRRDYSNSRNNNNNNNQKRGRRDSASKVQHY